MSMTISKLEAFLTMPDVSELTSEVTIAINGKPYTFLIRAMNQDEYSEYQKRAKMSVVKGSKNVNFNYGKFALSMAANQIVEPNFRDADFLKKAGFATAEDFVKRKLPSGAIQDLVDAIMKLSGYENDGGTEEDIEEAKNS